MATASTQTQTTIQYGKPVDAKDRELRGAQDLAALYGGVDYDRGQIEGIFQNAVDKEYAAKQAAYDRTANQYYNRLGQSQNAYLDAMRKSNAGAVMSGAAAGMQNANALSSLLGLSQQTSADNTMLTQEARALADQKAAAQSMATRDALDYANQQKLALGTLGVNAYGVDAQKYVGELGANAQMATANTAASAQGYTADQGLKGTKYAADQNLAGTKYAANANVSAARAGAAGYVQQAQIAAAAGNYQAELGLAGVSIQSASAVDVAKLNNIGPILNTGLTTGKIDVAGYMKTWSQKAIE